MEEDNRVTTLASLKGMTVRLAQQCLAAVTLDMPVHGKIEAYKRGLVLSEDDVVTIAGMAMDEWGFNLSREVRPNCYLCGERLPKHGERFCDCIMTSVTGIFVDTSRENLKLLVSMGEGKRVIASSDCGGCKAPVKHTAERAWGLLSSPAGRHIQRWKPPLYCPECHDKRRPVRNAPSKGTQKTRPPAVAQRMDLKSLQQQVAAEQPTINA